MGTARARAIGLMPPALAVWHLDGRTESGTVQAVGWLAGAHFVDEVGDAFEDLGGLINIIAEVAELG